MQNEVFAVVRSFDNLPKGEYGVSDTFSIIGIFTEEEVANSVKAAAEKRIKKCDKDGTEIRIVSFELNKIYPHDEEIIIGQSFYIE